MKTQLVKLTAASNQSSIYIRPDGVKFIQPTREGCDIRVDGFTISVIEDHKYVLELVDNNKRNKGKENGKDEEGL